MSIEEQTNQVLNAMADMSRLLASGKFPVKMARILDLSGIQPNIIRMADDSVLMEWRYSEFRAAFTIEKVQSESRWYLVAGPSLGNITAYGELTDVSFAARILTYLMATLLGKNRLGSDF